MSGRWALPPLTTGEMAPEFHAATRLNPRFHFSTVAGRYILLAFMPSDPAAVQAALAAFDAIRPRFDDHFLTAFFLVNRADGPDVPPDRIPGQRWFFDPERAVAPRYHVAEGEGAWFLFDPAQRLLARAPIDRPEALFARIAAGLPPLAAHAGTPLVAPALIVPRVFDPELCRRLIDIYEARGGQPSGVMRDIGGRTVGVIDGMKRRDDLSLEGDLDLRREIAQRIERTVVPMIGRTYQFRPTRIERYIVACYDAADRGFFGPHRDNETLGTIHRRFACSINLNAEEFAGGDLRFPEFGPRTYRPPTGGAVVFACNLQHEATPVTSGRRYAFLPFFYGEAEQVVRQRNLAFLESAPPKAADSR
ncbi:MAG: 2OG-Fe(II) oxygenase [Alphaproteobacteria bacterium]|nr:2OG-Fe(II) oxygenase [Alphaproteobacteria bacterium]MBU1513928.1 2OG-Fe(II) oxygenase [Alphaproteobacteria bacterium]MBU2094194.1 2OG-Fe(II) oxygenase [Alphaproteobacteria bacterium]MBU2150492.1 2OG-Fe(II) oxygenase [Alphaproteobacteria bacterium]MBU2307684.1 2OG-Fe(II) oxygenase [Alphaproteobacteria bacterium]